MGLQSLCWDAGARLWPLLSKKGWPRTTLHAPYACSKSEQQMRAVAKRGITRVLAAAKQRCFGALGGERQGLDSRAFMRSVAKGLLFAPPAAAPGIAFAGLELDLIGAELRTLWL